MITRPTESIAYDALCASLKQLGNVVVAFSGGVDSSLVAYVATTVLGKERVLCATAVSASLATDERADCAELAAEWDLRHVFVETNELEIPGYQKNDLNRCYFCKDELMDALQDLAQENDATIVLGVNLDDLGDHRPGQAAAAARGAAFPLVDAELTKEAVRSLSHSLELRTWNKPAAACLASRVPHGTPVTIEILTQVDRAEAALRRMGLQTLRVRHYGECARIEVDVDNFALVVSEREAIVDALHGVGYRYVTLDLEGFRSGNLSDAALRQQSTAKAGR